MITSTSKGAELRFPTANGGEGLAAHFHLRTDSAMNFILEMPRAEPQTFLPNTKRKRSSASNSSFPKPGTLIYDALDLDEIESGTADA